MRYSTSKNVVTFRSGSKVTQCHRNWQTWQNNPPRRGKVATVDYSAAHPLTATWATCWD